VVVEDGGMCFLVHYGLENQSSNDQPFLNTLLGKPTWPATKKNFVPALFLR
jgi:hypothetical protein